MSIRLTPQAVEKIQGLFRRHRLPETACLRIRVREGGCSGMSYAMSIASAPAEDDEVIDAHGVRLVCDPQSLTWLDGTEIDYDPTLVAGGFVFHNPNAQNVCNCGNSFGV